MRQPRRRPTFYAAVTLHDGTVTAAFPSRRPSKQELKQAGRRIDEDCVARGSAESGRQFSDVNYDSRDRFHDIIATRLNTRRAIRELVLPRIGEVLDEVRKRDARMERIEAMLAPSAFTSRSPNHS